ncbi:uncharacterized protein ACIB01_012901 isoform 1-T1 [Guaruba guarouba]
MMVRSPITRPFTRAPSLHSCFQKSPGFNPLAISTPIEHVLPYYMLASSMGFHFRENVLDYIAAKERFQSWYQMSCSRLRVPPPLPRSAAPRMLCLQIRSLLPNSRALGKCRLSRCHVGFTPALGSIRKTSCSITRAKVFWKIP